MSCNRCGKELTNPKSIARGYGPICWGKIGAPVTRKIKQRKVVRNLMNFLHEGPPCVGGCGYNLTTDKEGKLREKFLERGMVYCANYCCGCCPDSKVSPCQKERIEGRVIENLQRVQKCQNN